MKTNLVLERLEKGKEEIEHGGVNHDGLLRLLTPPGRKQGDAADAFERHQVPPVGVGGGGHLDAGEGDIDGGADTVNEEGAEGGGVGLGAEAP